MSRPPGAATPLIRALAAGVLRCPHPVGHDGPTAAAGAVLMPVDGGASCGAGHRFDTSRQGYLSLLAAGSRVDTGDSAEMVAARASFLSAGHYRPIADAVRDALGAAAGGVVADLGAGTGYYLDLVLSQDAGAQGIALDSSKFAARRAARLPRVAAVVADLWSPLPIADDCLDAALVIFAPRAPAELARALRPEGRLVVVTPLAEHLQEIRGPMRMLSIEPGKQQALAAGWPGFAVAASESVIRPMLLDAAAVRDLVQMGPAARHRSAGEIAADAGALGGSTSVTLAVTVTVLTKATAAERMD